MQAIFFTDVRKIKFWFEWEIGTILSMQRFEDFGIRF